MTDLFKRDNGNLIHKVAETDDEVQMHRANGFLELEELFPTSKESAPAESVQAKPRGRKPKAVQQSEAAPAE